MAGISEAASGNGDGGFITCLVGVGGLPVGVGGREDIWMDGKEESIRYYSASTV